MIDEEEKKALTETFIKLQTAEQGRLELERQRALLKMNEKVEIISSSDILFKELRKA